MSRSPSPWKISTSYYPYTNTRLWTVHKYDGRHHTGHELYRAIVSKKSFDAALRVIEDAVREVP